jgi:hypothetical protein
VSTLPATVDQTNEISRDLIERLQLFNQAPLVIADFGAVKLLECVDTFPRNERVQNVLFFQVAAVKGLVWPFDLDGDAGLALLANGNVFVIAFDRLTVARLANRRNKWLNNVGRSYTLPRVITSF